MSEKTSILIHNGAILTNSGWIKSGFLWIKDGIIQEIGKGLVSADLVNQANEIIDAQNCAILPGLTNAHTHLSQTFMRGLARGRSLIEWLNEVIWPIQNVISPEEMYLAALLGLVENLRCGAIWVTDHHKITTTTDHTDAVLRAAREINLRFTLARAWSDKGKNHEKPQEIIADLIRLYKETQDEEFISIANGPLALWRCSQKTLQDTQALALEHGGITHFHVSESQDELQMSLNEYGQRPVIWLNSIGMLGDNTQIVHAVWVNDEEIDTISRTNASVIHCPISNAILGSGIAPISKMMSRNIEIRLGTDGPASNDTQDIWETLKASIAFIRAVNLDPTILSPSQALNLATGGKTLNIWEPADLIIVDLNHPRVVPVQDYYSALVLGTHGNDVRSVIVAGKILLREGKLTVVDELALYEECKKVMKLLIKRAGVKA